MSEESFETLRTSYGAGALDEEGLHPDPMLQFGAWLSDAIAIEKPDPGAMTLATVDAHGRPAARVVLLRGHDPRGFVFYTNYGSRKGRELDGARTAALVFLWKNLQRQVRVEGSVARISAEESDAYFASRPRGHRLSAWASDQSSVVPDRATLERQMAAVEARFADDEVARPPYWGGYRVVPATIEFWQGRPNRVHDRLRYRRSGEHWIIERLSP